ncbi:carbohydrate binding domain-containing protein [Ruminococcus flavefaciens]|uniref:PA14 domain-containing protein n=1 Tax=Ruminococcus flavefaciens 007c TaxID=1341157 RepID=W7UN76_RUMFL|nr:carbohydrate binding domain-containing protein [Ruminococcus flavefaciens]EWM53034.1 hypothetical protein RF007C_15590 [Ruminococcus flavefaciens 007c]
MKNYIDGFYELIHKNSLKRRRMISLLLVLSLFVSTGVLWELRDTGITMVNDAQCGLKEHTHTDACYQDVLICGLEENEEHTHTAECYERRLICGYNEHIHDMSCYGIDDELIDEETDDELFALSGSYGDSGEETDEEFLVADLPDLTLGNEIELLASENVQNAPYINPGFKTTIDNIAEGIKFTLFDYGDSNLESQTNNYGFAEDWGQGGSVVRVPYEHNNIATSGINTGRNPVDDIMFFAYGTPIPANIQPSTDYVFYNYMDGNVHKYNPDKNSYSGDYNSTPHYSGNRSISGIVKTELGEDGYPVMNNATGNSLAYLFAPTTDVTVNGQPVDQSEYKTVYEDVNHLLQRNTENDHLFFNSDDNYAYYDKDSGDFIIYDKTYPVINPDHHKDTDTDYHHLDENGEPTEYDDNKPEFKIGFFPFDEYDPTRRDPNYNGNGYNHHFGMTMEAKFVNPSPENLVNGDPVSFKYSGDDDMWVFVDGKLVLDLGGIHEPAGGMIDFTNGLAWTQDNELGRSISDVMSDLISTEGNGINSEADFNKLPMPIGSDTTGSGNKWIVTPLTQYLGDDWDALVDGKKPTHEIKMFYLERGGCYSNLAMDMNLPTLKPLTIKKNVDYQKHLVKDPLIDDMEYGFQVWEWKDNEWIQPDLPNTDHGYFTIKDGERMTFEDLEQHRQFKITEIGVDPNIFDQVSVNGGTPTELNPGGGDADISSNEDPVALSTNNSYIFTNRVIEDDQTKLFIKKNWSGGTKPNGFKMKYKIMRTDSATGEVKQIALKYKTTDPDTNQEVEKKRRTFILENESGEEITGLLTRYGNHVYSYRIEEVNAPEGFKASYKESVDENGRRVYEITNIDIANTDIYVKKEWGNTPPDGQPAVKLILKREKVGYLPSQPTDLRVNIVDEGGNPIVSKTYTNLYANGSAEIFYDLPEGVELYKGDPDYPSKRIKVLTCTNTDPDHEHIDSCYKNNNAEVPLKILTCTNTEPDHEHTDSCYQNNNKANETLYVKFEEDEYILVVQNLAAKEEAGDTEPANEVTFKVTSDNAEDSLLLLHHSFTRGTNGWSVQNDASKGTNAKVEPSGYNAYAKGDALRVYDRTKSFNGATLKLDPAKFKMNKTYTFSTYVYYDDTNNTNAPDSIQFNFTFNDGLNKENNGSYRGISSKTVQKGQWTQLTGTITLPESIDPYNMFIIVETANPDQNNEHGQYEAPLISQFYMDEFTAIEGNTQVEVEEDTGRVIVSGASVASNTEITNVTFNSTTLPDGWSKNNTLNLSVADGSLLLSERQSNNAGIQRSVSSILQAGHSYRFEVGYQHHDGQNGAGNAHLTLYYQNNGDQYTWVCNTNIPDTSGDHFKHYDASQVVDIPAGANMSNARIYFETNNDTKPYRLRYLRIYDVTETTTPVSGNKDGYEIISGKYYSDYSNYDLDLDENSVTNPLHLDGQYTLDSAFSKEITLPTQGTLYDDGTGKMMGYHWGKADLGEQSGYLYRYWVEEVKIGDDDVETDVVLNGEEKTVESTHDDYIISYDRQFVATNTEDSPILVKNKYIWYKLPATGGRGTTGIYILGTVLTTIGILSGCTAYRRRRRRDRNGFLK